MKFCKPKKLKQTDLLKLHFKISINFRIIPFFKFIYIEIKF